MPPTAPFAIEPIEAPTPTQLEAIYSPLREFNAQAAAEAWQARLLKENEAKALHLFARDDEGAILGGLVGSTQFRWLKIDLMATAADHRGRGIGTALVARAEQIAAERGCRYAYVDTMSYQAPAFYRKNGYAIAGEIADWDSHGNAKCFLTKRLV